MKHFCSFSEAIRAADGVLEQSFYGPSARDILNVDRGKVCAIEGGIYMMEVPIGPDSDWIYKFAKRQFPYLNKRTSCPLHDSDQCDMKTDTIGTLIWHLNDDHHLTFAQIADWLETEEEKIGYITLVESESSSESLPAVAVLSV